MSQGMALHLEHPVNFFLFPHCLPILQRCIHTSKGCQRAMLKRTHSYRQNLRVTSKQTFGSPHALAACSRRCSHGEATRLWHHLTSTGHLCSTTMLTETSLSTAKDKPVLALYTSSLVWPVLYPILSTHRQVRDGFSQVERVWGSLSQLLHISTVLPRAS